MKKTLAITSALAASFVAANAAPGDFGLVGGFSFTGINVASETVDTDKSDFLPDAISSPVGSFALFGNLGAGEQDITALAAGAAFNTFPGGLSSNLDITTRPSSQDFVNNDSFLQITNFQGAVTAFEFTFDALATGEAGFENWEVVFAGAGDLDIDWSISVDGGAFSGVGSTAIAGADNGYSLSFADAATNLVLRGELSNYAAGSNFGIDNLAVYGTSVVPEPSTYAAIAGALALGFVAYRRRK